MKRADAFGPMSEDRRGPDPTTLRMVAWLARCRAQSILSFDAPSRNAAEDEDPLSLFASDLENIAGALEAAAGI